jgi:dimeric dUTPase (all-alpha-NTP-PPase superfamily)
MNLQKLFEAQRKLDEHIIREKGLAGQDLLPMKILALQVELGELANEWRGFKFWSEDREPRTRVAINQNKFGKYGCSLEFRNPLLEEYVDCLHFVLSIGLDLVHRKPVEILQYHWNCTLRFDNITDQFLCLFADMSELWDDGELQDSYSVFFTRFIELGKMIGFTLEQIEEAYFAKNRINHERQERGY